MRSSQSQFTEHIIYGIKTYVPAHYHIFIERTLKFIMLASPKNFAEITLNIKTIHASPVKVNYGFLKNSLVIPDDYGDLGDSCWLAERLVAGAILSGYVTGNSYSMWSNARLCKQAWSEAGRVVGLIRDREVSEDEDDFADGGFVGGADLCEHE